MLQASVHSMTRHGTPVVVPPGAEEKRLLDVLEQAPAERLVAILKCIKGWQFEGQASLFNWSAVLDKVHTQLTAALTKCPRLLLVAKPEATARPDETIKQESGEKKENETVVISEEEHEALADQVYELLRFSAMLLENASYKQRYNAVESVVACLGARDDRIAFEATHVLAMLALPPQQHRYAVDPTTYADNPAAGNIDLQRRLLTMVSARGSVREGLRLAEQHVATAVNNTDEHSTTTLYQFYRQMDSGSSELISIPFDADMFAEVKEEGGASNTTVVHTRAATICEALIQKYDLPSEHHFGLFMTVRAYCHAQSNATSESSVVQRLHALVALFYVFSDAWEVVNLVEVNPDMTRSMVELIRVENSDVVPIRVRLAALQVLSALVYDRAGRAGVGILGRQSNVFSVLGVSKGTPHGVFPSLVRYCLTELSSLPDMPKSGQTGTKEGQGAGVTTTGTSETDNDMEMSLAVAFVHATTDLLSPKDAEVLSVGVFRDVANSQDRKLCWIEGVLGLLNNVVSMQSGAAVLTENGVVPALLHVISSRAANPFHTSLITMCLQALETTVSVNSAAAALYRELNGVGIIIDRLSSEITGAQLSDMAKPGSTDTKIVLIIALLVMLSVSFHSQGVMSAGATSRVIRDGSPLSKALIAILNGVDVFGPVVFAQASVVVSDIINNDPSSVNQIHSGGVADAFLQTITRWEVADMHPVKLLPGSAELVMAIPSVLSALCLTTELADKVAKYKPLVYLFDMFALPDYALNNADYLQGDVASIVGSGIFEMMRQVSGFQSAAVQACVEAGKKIIRFGGEYTDRGADTSHTSEEHYGCLLRMTTHLCDLLEPILTKSEHAVCFADNGGVQCLFQMYRLILPTTSSFMSNLQVARNIPGESSRFTHQPAAQAITLALRSFASQQPATMLAALIAEIGVNLDRLRDGKAAIDAAVDAGGEQKDGLLCSLSNDELNALFGGNITTSANMSSGSALRIQAMADYLRVLAFIEWLTGLLVWTMQTAHNHLHSRRWFTELSSRSNRQTLARLFVVDRSVQLERANLAAFHRKVRTESATDDGSAQASNCNPGCDSSDNLADSDSATKVKGVWKLCSLILLRFTLVTRSLLVGMSKSFLTTSIQHRRGDDGTHPLAPYARRLAKFVADTIRGHTHHVTTSTEPMTPFVKKYYLTFLLETIIQVVFDTKKKQPNTLVLVKLFSSPDETEDAENDVVADGNSSVVSNAISYLLEGCLSADQDKAMDRMNDTSLRVSMGALQQFSDLEHLRSSPLTASLTANDDSSSNGERTSFDLHKLSMALHRMCLEIVLKLWRNPMFPEKSASKSYLGVLPVIVTLLKNRLDIETETNSTANNDRMGSRGRDFPFGRVHDRDDFFHALFGTHPGQPRRDASRRFEVDAAIVDSLVGMGFQRQRIEHAIRRLQVNDVELAMEWLLSHPDEDGEEKTDETEHGAQEVDSAVVIADTPAEVSVSPERSEDECLVFEGYNTLRESFESGCFAILRCQAILPAGENHKEDVYPHQQVVHSVAQYLSLMCMRSETERDRVIGQVNSCLLEIFTSTADSDVRFGMVVTHMLALILRFDDEAPQALMKQALPCVQALVDYMSAGVSADGTKLNGSYAAVLLVMEAIERSDNHASHVDAPIEENSDDSSSKKLAVSVRRQLVKICVELMKSTNLDKITAHAMWQLLTRLALDYELASLLYSSGGVDAILSIKKEVTFPGYKQLTCTLFARMLESPEVLEHTMEVKIRQAMSKLSERFGAPTQMRITPRALLMEVATVAARNEKIFLKALQKSVVVRRSESGRTYVAPKEVDLHAQHQSSEAPSSSSNVDDTEDKKNHLHRQSKGLRQHSHALVHKIVDKIYEVWREEKDLAQSNYFDEKNTDDSKQEDDQLCVGTYLQFLVHIVTLFPVCATALTKQRDHCSNIERDYFIRLLLREFLPSKELCRFAVIRRSLKSAGVAENGSLDSSMQRVTAALTKPASERIKNTHKLLVAIGGHSGDGSKIIVNELVKLFQEWPLELNRENISDLSIIDENALSSLHAWSALIMTMLWPRGTTKTFSWDKVVLGGGLKGKFGFVTLLAEALRKISLSHPLAHTTCAMLLRPLATLTRSFVTHRVSRLLKKKDSTVDQEVVTQESGAGQRQSTGVEILNEQSEVATTLDSQRDGSGHRSLQHDDVSMLSPASIGDHDMLENRNVSDDGSDRSSLSDHSVDDHNVEDDDDEDEDDDDDDDDAGEDEEDEEDEDEEDGDEDDDEDDEDEESDEIDDMRMHLRVMRRARDGASRASRTSRPWGALDGDMSADALDEVDEEEFSYISMLDDEAVFAEEQRRRIRQSRSRQTGSSGSTSAEAQTNIRSLVNVFSLDGDVVDSRAGMFAFGDEDDDEDDPDMAFRNIPLNRIREVAVPSMRGLGGLNNVGNALLQIVENRGDDDDEFIFETVEGGGTRRMSHEQGGQDHSGLLIHPLLRSTDPNDVDRDRFGNSSRYALPRHSTLLRELQELTEQVQTQLPFSLTGRALMGRELLRPGRNRPPSRNRLSAVSNLLSEFSLDIPTHAPFVHSRRNRPGAGRSDDELLQRTRPVRSEGLLGVNAGSGLHWGGVSGHNNDIRSVAARLEQHINQLYVEPGDFAPSATDTHPDRTSRESTRDTPGEDGDNEPITADSDTMAGATSSRNIQTAVSESSHHSTGDESLLSTGSTANIGRELGANESASDTASVIALASTLGESSLRSPMDDAGSEPEMSVSPILSSVGTTPRISEEVVGRDSETPAQTTPPPAPMLTQRPASNDLMNFTLDLSSFQQADNAPQSTEPRQSREEEEEMKGEEPGSDEVDTSPSTERTGGLTCPDGVDPEVFASLPADMQAEIVAQHVPAAAASTVATEGSESFSQLDLDMQSSSFDRETLEALPPDIREEVLANERREREAAARTADAPADISRAEEMDNASFVASLAPGLREEILTTCDDAFLQTLPSQVQAEAMVLRERVTFRSAYREPPQRATTHSSTGEDYTDDIFYRPTLRRMLTSQNSGVFGGRRSSRRNADGSSRRARDELDSSRAGMVRVHRDEEEEETERILDDHYVQAIVRLLFMNQSIVHNRVFQRVISNVCLYPLTRNAVRKYLLSVLTLGLDRPLALPDKMNRDDFPPKEMYGCGSSWAAATDTRYRRGVPTEVMSRVLQVLVSLVKHNARLAVDMLHCHGMHRAGENVDMSVGSESESGATVLIELLSSPSVTTSGTILDTLLELIERIVSPLDRLKLRPSTVDEEEKKDDAPQQDAEWVEVPKVTLDSSLMIGIVGVLCLDICTPQMQERTLHILKLLDKVPSNRKLVLDALVHQAKRLTSLDRYQRPPFVGFESSAVLQSAQDELKLLRVLHTISDLCGTSAEFSECCSEIRMDPLWEALSRALDDARALGGLNGSVNAEPVGMEITREPEEVGSASISTSPHGGSADDGQTDDSEAMVIEGKSAGASCAMAALLARFLPMVEAFFVVNARDAASLSLALPASVEKEEAVVQALRVGGFGSVESRTQNEQGSSVDPETKSDDIVKRDLKRLSSTISESGESTRLAEFVEANRVLLNLLVREKPSLLDSSLAALIKMPRCRAFLDFDNKRTYFQSAMKKLRQTALRTHVGSSSVRISVRREHIFEDSYYALRMRSGPELRRKLHISFSGEEGIDAGGVTREWYVILAREIFNPNYVLFTSAADSPTFQPNPLSYVNKDHLSYFEFVGKVIGKAVADGQLLDAHFTRSFYKHILQLPISYHDMEAIDPEYYRNLHSILDTPMVDLGLDLTFSAEQSNFGRVEIVDLIPNGRNIAVTDENKMEYVQLVTHHRMATGIRQQIDSFLKGFHQLAPPELISIFNENELELLISGMPEIDIDDLKAHTEYANYKPTDSVIRWFWNVLYTINHEERALFLQFVTGTSKVPLEGFKALEGMRGTQKFNIHKAFGNPNALPSAHTCFNQLDLPEYESEEKLRQCLLLAIREGSEGFGFG